LGKHPGKENIQNITRIKKEKRKMTAKTFDCKDLPYVNEKGDPKRKEEFINIVMWAKEATITELMYAHDMICSFVEQNVALAKATIDLQNQEGDKTK
jgi:hypothetical protein